MYLFLRDDLGTIHPVRDAAPQELIAFGRRCWASNSALAARAGDMPDPVVGLKKAIAAAAAAV
jgi:hypothetical protein